MGEITRNSTENGNLQNSINTAIKNVTTYLWDRVAETIQSKFPIKEDINTPESIEKIRNAFSFFKDEILPLILENPKVTQQKEWYHGLFTHTRNVVFRGICYAVSLGEDPIPVAFACACHDLARVNNWYNKEHWPNAVPVTTEIINNEKFNLTEEQKQQIIEAVVNHTTWMQATNYVSACLRDADRTRLSWERWYKESFFSTEQWKKIWSWSREEFLEFQTLCIGSERWIKKVDSIVKDSEIPDILKSDYHIDEGKKAEYEKLLNKIYAILNNNPYRSLDEQEKELCLKKFKDNYKDYLAEGEFVDVLMEIDDDQYDAISSFISIPKEILGLRQNFNVREFKDKIMDYVNVKTWQREKDQAAIMQDFGSFIEKYKNNMIFKYIMAIHVNNWHFWNIQKDFNLSEEILRLRKSRDEYILQNIEEFDPEKIKDALFDVLFADNIKNVALKLDTILDREKFVPDFLGKKDLEMILLIKDFIYLDVDNKEQIWKSVKILKEKNKELERTWLSLKILVENHLEKARSDFQEDLKKALKETNIFDGESEELETTSWKKVKLYKINDASDRDVLLVRSLKLENSGYGKLCKEKYDEYLNRERKTWFSYSLISPNRIEKHVFRESGVTFWFLWLWNNDVKFANTFDSHSWWCHLPKHTSQFFPIQKFLEYSGNDGYNELFISNDEKIYPDYIVSRDNPPAQELIDLACDFWIPIVFNSTNWKDPSGKYKKYVRWEWDYRDEFPKSRWIVSISHLFMDSEKWIKKVDSPTKDSEIPDILKLDYHIDEEKKAEYKKLLSPLSIEKTISKVKDILDKIPVDREFIDCLVEMWEYYYQKLIKLVDVPREITVLREKFKTFNQYIDVIRRYCTRCTYGKGIEYVEKLKENLNDPMFKYIITYMTDNRLFNNLQNDLDLPKEIGVKRNSYNNYILENINTQDIIKIQDALCDLLFNDNAKNIELNLGAISDRMKYVPNFLDDENKKLFDLLYKFMKLNWTENTDSKEDVQELIKKIKFEDEKLRDWWSNLKQRLFDMIDKAKTDFQNDLKNWLSQIDFSSESYQELNTTTWEKVKFYEMKNLKDSHFLVRAIKFKDTHNNITLNRGKYKDYLHKEGKKGCGYSLIGSNFSKTNLFGFRYGDDTALFWFFWFWENKVMSATTFDSDLNSSPWLFRYKQQFFPLKAFWEWTKWHNEVFISNEEKLYPDYIISLDNPPKQELIDLAHEFWLPIVFINQKEKKWEAKGWYSKELVWAYDYYSFGSKQYVSPKCKPVESFSKFLAQF